MANFAGFVGLRYSLGRGGGELLSFLSRLSMAGLIIGIAILVTVLSVMNGFDREMRQRILALVPHISLEPWNSQSEDWQSLREQVLRHDEVRAAAPYMTGNALLIKAGSAEPVQFFGIDPVAEAEVSSLGDFAELSLLGDDAVVLGSGLAQRLGVAVNDSVNLAIPAEKAGVRFHRFDVAGIAATGTELDHQLVLMHIVSAVKLMPDARPSLRVSVEDVFAAPRVAWELSTVHGGDFIISDWSRQFGNMYHAIQMSRKLVVIMLLSVVAVAVFNIVSTLVMVVNDKRGDIAILRSQGAGQFDILKIFLVYGAMIGGIGSVLGSLAGVILSLGIGDLLSGIEALFGVKLLSSEVYPISYLPVDIRLADVMLVAATAYVMSIFASLYPAWRASRLPPAEALRHG
ncbi:lipoprotein-releasing ABC transporter permease subunit [Spongiibacter sp. KMU-166]|uniref:Lipoprotein-releasing ABC transporter permease subunit n=1 Tax=Spongiibacter thalassae TaxID=2721624 RepID=A0ABX1GE68_9GAMM|nr:lipoprotein-releasing ABC transporter permease subunit [Spongiibacter thalassae]NKI17231.1 lipoprotein-releasing ABC transporter permease subunit [Spongiibacter thalassae]